MRRLAAVARRLVREGLEPIFTFVALLPLRWLGLVAPVPLWLVAGTLAVAVVVLQPTVERRLGTGTRGLWLRVALLVGLATTFLGECGWTPFLPLACVVVLARFHRTVGSGAWRPVAVLGSVATIGLYAAAALGWVPSLLAGTQGVLAGAAVLIGSVGTGRQLTWSLQQQELAESARRTSDQRLRALARVQGPSDIITVADATGRLTYLDRSVERLMGYADGELNGTGYAEMIHPDDRGPAAAAFAAVLQPAEPGFGEGEHPHVGAAGGAQRQAHLRLRYADGSWHWHEVVLRNLLDDPDVRGIVFNHRDITERRAFEERLAYDASHDALTGLANRGTFLRELKRATGDAERSGHRCAVLVLDLNEFKQINDTLGSETAEGLLVALGRLLDRSVFGADTVARLGTDELAILLSRIDSPEDADAVARRVMTGLAEPLDAAGQPVHAQVCIGAAVSGPDCQQPADLLHRADLAKRAAKRQKLNGWLPYTDALRAQRSTPAPTAEELRIAIHSGQLRLQYQPIVALDSGELRGLEALVRWQHPVLGWLGPAEFVPLAEASGFIVPLGEWVLEEACHQLRRWQHRSAAGRCYMSVNLSPRQLEQDALVGKVRGILARTGVDPRDLVLEVTENALVNDASAIPVLAELNAAGIRIALDDFGTGYSSLRYLTSLPADILKLDRCFVSELDGTSEGSAVAQAVIRLGQALNLDTIAEGIETAAQATELTLLGCRLAQGYLFARPLDPRAIDSLLDAAGPRWPILCPAALTDSPPPRTA